MNRADRRRLQRAVKRQQVKHPVPASLTLYGGPMSGWVVKPNAPALKPDWRAKFLAEKARHAYELTRLAEAEKNGVEVDVFPAWEALDDDTRDHFHAVTRDELGDGRYVQAQLPCPVTHGPMESTMPHAHWHEAG